MSLPLKLKRLDAACLALAVGLVGCGSAPTVVDPRGPAEESASQPAGGALSTFESAQRQRAMEQERQGHLADAAWSWEVLSVLRPDNAEYRDSLAAVRRRIDSAVAERLQRAQQAHKRGETESAATHYLTVLSLQPDNAQAAEALRSLERERNRRSYLGKPSRITLARRAPEAEGKPAARAAAAAPQDRNELEHVALLANQGELDEAIAQLERHVAADRRDTAARQLLADLYFQKADKLGGRGQKQAATVWLQKSLKLDAGHARAAALLKQLQAEPLGAAAAAPNGGAAARSAR
jgi:tetratricopeptide (TPR) repeat protein